MLQLVEYKESYKEALHSLQIKRSQTGFVSSIDEIIKKYHSIESAKLLVYLHYEKIVGLCLYRVNEEYENVFLWQMIVDVNSQGMGFGRALLVKVENYILTHEKYSKIITTVKSDNMASCMLFLTQGYQEFNENEDEIDFEKSLK